MRFRLPAIAALLLALFSCSSPSSFEDYVKIQDKQGGMYAFTIDMTDSLSRYDISFYTRLDGNTKTSTMPLDIRWVSPDGQEYGERAWFCAGAEGVRVVDTFFSRQMTAPYREGLVPVVPGIWTLKVATDAPGMRGLGVILKKKPI